MPSHTERKTNQNGKEPNASLEKLLTRSVQGSRECNNPKPQKTSQLSTRNSHLRQVTAGIQSPEILFCTSIFS